MIVCDLCKRPKKNNAQWVKLTSQPYPGVRDGMGPPEELACYDMCEECLEGVVGDIMFAIKVCTHAADTTEHATSALESPEPGTTRVTIESHTGRKFLDLHTCEGCEELLMRHISSSFAQFVTDQKCRCRLGPKEPPDPPPPSSVHSCGLPKPPPAPPPPPENESTTGGPASISCSECGGIRGKHHRDCTAQAKAKVAGRNPPEPVDRRPDPTPAPPPPPANDTTRGGPASDTYVKCGGIRGKHYPSCEVVQK